MTTRANARRDSWAEANQAYLVAEFARLREKLRGETANSTQERGEATKAVRRRSRQAAQPPAIDRLAEIFNLSSFERGVVLLCAGVEMDSALAALCSEALSGAERPQRPGLTFGLAMAVLAEPHWSALTASGPLRRYHLVEVESGYGLTCSPLRIDERILHYLAGINQLDPRLESLLEASPPVEWIAEDHRRLAAELAKVAANAESVGAFHEGTVRQQPVLHLCGDDPHGQQDVAALATAGRGRQLFVLHAEDKAVSEFTLDAGPGARSDIDRFLELWTRESALLDGVLLVQCGAEGPNAATRRIVERAPGCVFVASREPVRINRELLRFDVNKPRPEEQKHLWQQALGPSAARLNGFLDNLSEQFRLSAKTIYATGSLHTSGDAAVLWSSCRALARPRLENLAQRIVPSASWDDLVLPEVQKDILRQIAAQVGCRMKVYETWGFSERGRRGLGISALFAGESGTGKTLAAEVLASELALDLYRIDLSAVVSKYIGETEKNLREVFDAAEEGGVLLLFDEADALFGKRSDVKESLDRYSNIEVSYLLQRMEAYQGLAVLTTNQKSSIDRAFQRRLRFTVNFPFPDAAQRESIWRRTFPAATPTSNLDPAKLSQLKVAGGNIRNIALNAAFLAADAKEAVGMAHLLEAARFESVKIERPLSDAETRGWV